MDDIDTYLQDLPTSLWTMTTAQRRYLKEHVAKRAPCHFLVWGVGVDSPLWQRCNPGGTTVFIEDNHKWIERTTTLCPALDIVEVRYATRRWQWRKLIENPQRLSLGLPDSILRRKWDVIFVDAPAGWIGWQPGRMQSIYTSHELCAGRDAVDVFVHDINRRVEKHYSDRFLGPDNLVCKVANLAHYRTATTVSCPIPDAHF